MNKTFRQTILALAGLGCLAAPVWVSAHAGGAVMDIEGNSAEFSTLTQVTCFDDGNGVPDHIIAQIEDKSPPVPGLLTTLVVMKGSQMLTASDPFSGDGEPGPYIRLHGGPGVYTMMANKTAAGARDFEVEWHCNAVDNTHTGTDIRVLQFGLPVRP